MDDLRWFLGNSSIPVKVVDLKWERIQLLITLYIEGQEISNLDFYLYNPATERSVDFQHVENENNLVQLRINLITSWEDLSPVPSGRWILIARERGTEKIGVSLTDNKLIDSDAEQRDKNMNLYNMDHYRRVFYQSKKTHYSIRPMADEETGLFCLSLFFKGGKSKRSKKQIRADRRRKKRAARNLKIRKNLFVFIFDMASRLIGAKDNRILFTSDSRAELGGNMEFIYNRLKERGLDKKYKITMLFKSNITERRRFWDKFRLPYHLAVSKTILVDDFHPLLYQVSFSGRQNIIQLWHASGPFKTVGYSRVGKPGGPGINGKSHKIYTSAIVGSEYSVPFYAEAFGMNEEDVYPTGIPRMDPFFSEDYRKSIREKMFEEFPQAKKADKVILFAPTFRGNGPKTAYYPMYQIELDELASYAKRNNAIIIFKLHPFVRNNIEIPRKYKDYFIDAYDYREINDILFISDLLITDYSSVVFEYSLLDKPMLFYAFDLQRYTLTRDFYEGFSDFVPGKIIFTFKDLIEALEKKDFEIEKVEKFRNKYFKFQDSGSTDRVIDWLIMDNFPEGIPKGAKQKALSKGEEEL